MNARPRDGRRPRCICRPSESLLRRPGWTPVEKAAYDAATTEPFGTLSALLRRIRATAGAGPVNTTDVWTSGRGLRLETTDGPPCPGLIRS
ncbi:hypothetical protein [Streptomyces parvus]|uniref:Uncharacterized protein n=1 Tax=Streptomyces parvus TaxID=66428 RepID=A0A5D4I0V8_9ACTN|nr:hypothetical protein [Streptomyces parvus]TYR44820.1 hypothetical protein FY004_37680 [Streptomyces parvus]